MWRTVGSDICRLNCLHIIRINYCEHQGFDQGCIEDTDFAISDNPAKRTMIMTKYKDEKNDFKISPKHALG
jgi:hypothetical protein